MVCDPHDSFKYALYNAFTDTIFGGSPAAIVSDAASLDLDMRRRLAREIGTPATAFVDNCQDKVVTVQFLSAVAELPMCGHGTVCLITRLLDSGLLRYEADESVRVNLRLPSTNAIVEIKRQDNGRAMVMLDVRVPGFRQDDFDLSELSALLGLEQGDYRDDLPQETASADFVHLILPLKNLWSMRRIKPDFEGIIGFCHRYGIQTVTAFCSEVEQAGYDLHVRDFCPAVGVAESAAAGTTNAALCSYLIRHGLVNRNNEGLISVLAEQGHEIQRPSSIRSMATMDNNQLSRLQVGGVASKVIEGFVYLSS